MFIWQVLISRVSEFRTSNPLTVRIKYSFNIIIKMLLVIPAEQPVRECPNLVIPAKAGIQKLFIINDL